MKISSILLLISAQFNEIDGGAVRACCLFLIPEQLSGMLQLMGIVTLYIYVKCWNSASIRIPFLAAINLSNSILTAGGTL